jgi:ribonuclease HI
MADNILVMDISAGEAKAALLAIEVVVTFPFQNILLEGDSLLVITAINNTNLCVEWHIAYN